MAAITNFNYAKKHKIKVCYSLNQVITATEVAIKILRQNKFFFSSEVRTVHTFYRVLNSFPVSDCTSDKKLHP